MNDKLPTIQWDKFDEDRWILASISSVIILIITFMILKSIHIPLNPEKKILDEKFEYFHEVKKKKKVVKEKEEKKEVTKREVTQKQIAIVTNLFVKSNRLSKRRSAAPKSRKKVQNFMKKDRNLTSSRRTVIKRGEKFKRRSNAPIIRGFNTRFKNNKITSEDAIYNPIPDKKGVNESIGQDFDVGVDDDLPVTDEIQIFNSKIKLKEIISPLLEYIRKHNKKIDIIAQKYMLVKPRANYTTKEFIHYKGKKYELLLASKPSKNQITFIIIDLADSTYYKLIDQGLTEKSQKYETGFVKWSDKPGSEVIEFTGEERSTAEKRAKLFEQIFWSWASEVAK